MLVSVYIPFSFFILLFFFSQYCGRKDYAMIFFFISSFFIHNNLSNFTIFDSPVKHFHALTLQKRSHDLFSLLFSADHYSNLYLFRLDKNKSSLLSFTRSFTLHPYPIATRNQRRKSKLPHLSFFLNLCHSLFQTFP